MLTRAIPRTGEQLPAIGMGTWSTFDVGSAPKDRDPLAEVMCKLVAAGGTVIDSSPMYGRAESVVGELATETGLANRLFLATKVWTQGAQAGIAQMAESMRRMRCERLDLMQVHNLVDVETHLRTLRRWKDEGRVRYLGITHYSLSAFDELERLMRQEQVDFLQLPYSLGTRAAEKRLLPVAREAGTAVLVMRPLEEGSLLRRVRGRPLPGWAKEIDCSSWAQLLLKFILAHPAVTCAIPATSNPAHMADDLKAGEGRLPDEKLRQKMIDLFE